MLSGKRTPCQPDDFERGLHRTGPAAYRTSFSRGANLRLYSGTTAGLVDDFVSIMVSPRLREDFEKGRDYYALNGSQIALPSDPNNAPSRENMIYHAEQVFR
jgi:putative restriction endonuclease